ncbi:hypothetical protein BC830DRAFT_1169780 [Chytriomyces sp. MP71]|nr:hypothetical protein BC830DRAFT_1169780 [Chytriomyces sp. MP71]
MTKTGSASNNNGSFGPNAGGSAGSACFTTLTASDARSVLLAAAHLAAHLGVALEECETLVAEKVFPFYPDPNDEHHPECGLVLRGPHINAVGKKFYLEHFGCHVFKGLSPARFTHYEPDDKVPTLPRDPVAMHRRMKRIIIIKLEVLRAQLAAIDFHGHGTEDEALSRIHSFSCGSFIPDINFQWEFADHLSEDTMALKSKCGGCQTAVLKKFVEMRKEGVLYQWHPQCYMIYKLWNVKANFQHEHVTTLSKQDPEAEISRQPLTLAKLFEVCLDQFIEYVDALFKGINAIDSQLAESGGPAEGISAFALGWDEHTKAGVASCKDDQFGLIYGKYIKELDSTGVEWGVKDGEVVNPLKCKRQERTFDSDTCILDFLSLLMTLEKRNSKEHSLTDITGACPDGEGTLKSVTQLQQFSFLLLCSLGRLYTLLNAQDPRFGQSDPGTDVDEPIRGSGSYVHLFAQYRSADELGPSDDENHVHNPQIMEEFQNLPPLDPLQTIKSIGGRMDRNIPDALENILGRKLPDLEMDSGNSSDTKVTVWSRLMKGGNVGKKAAAVPVKKSGTFGVPLAILVQDYGVETQLIFDDATVRIPKFVELCIQRMRNLDMSVEGVFRKNGNIRRLKETAELFDLNPTLDRLDEESSIQVAALLKKFLRDMPDPLLTSKLHPLFIASQSELIIARFILRNCF